MDSCSRSLRRPTIHHAMTIHCCCLCFKIALLWPQSIILTKGKTSKESESWTIIWVRSILPSSDAKGHAYIWDNKTRWQQSTIFINMTRIHLFFFSFPLMFIVQGCRRSWGPQLAGVEWKLNLTVKWGTGREFSQCLPNLTLNCLDLVAIQS